MKKKRFYAKYLVVLPVMMHR